MFQWIALHLRVMKKDDDHELIFLKPNIFIFTFSTNLNTDGVASES